MGPRLLDWTIAAGGEAIADLFGFPAEPIGCTATRCASSEADVTLKDLSDTVTRLVTIRAEEPAYAGLTGTATITVVPEVSISPANAAVRVGDAMALVAEANELSGSSFTWSSIFPGVATVEGTGAQATVIARSPGRTRITAAGAHDQTASAIVEVFEEGQFALVAASVSGVSWTFDHAETRADVHIAPHNLQGLPLSERTPTASRSTFVDVLVEGSHLGAPLAGSASSRVLDARGFRTTTGEDPWTHSFAIPDNPSFMGLTTTVRVTSREIVLTVSGTAGGSALDGALTFARICRDGDRDCDVPTVATIEVTPPERLLTVGQGAQFAAILRDASGAVVQGDVVWEAFFGPDVFSVRPASVDQTGFVTGDQPGWATVRAIHKGVVGSALVGVLPPREVSPGFVGYWFDPATNPEHPWQCHNTLLDHHYRTAQFEADGGTLDLVYGCGERASVVPDGNTVTVSLPPPAHDHLFHWEMRFTLNDDNTMTWTARGTRDTQFTGIDPRFPGCVVDDARMRETCDLEFNLTRLDVDGLWRGTATHPLSVNGRWDMILEARGSSGTFVGWALLGIQDDYPAQRQIGGNLTGRFFTGSGVGPLDVGEFVATDAAAGTGTVRDDSLPAVAFSWSATRQAP